MAARPTAGGGRVTPKGSASPAPARTARSRAVAIITALILLGLLAGIAVSMFAPTATTPTTTTAPSGT